MKKIILLISLCLFTNALFAVNNQNQNMVPPIRKIAIVSLYGDFMHYQPTGFFETKKKKKQRFNYAKDLNLVIEKSLANSLQNKFEIVPISLEGNGISFFPYPGTMDKLFARSSTQLANLVKNNDLDAILFIYPYIKNEENMSTATPAVGGDFLTGFIVGAISGAIKEAVTPTYLTAPVFTTNGGVTLDGQVGLFDFRQWKSGNFKKAPKQISSHGLSLNASIRLGKMGKRVILLPEEQKMVVDSIARALPKRLPKVLSYMKSLQQESARNGLNGPYVENRRPNTKGRKA